MSRSMPSIHPSAFASGWRSLINRKAHSSIFSRLTSAFLHGNRGHTRDPREVTEHSLNIQPVAQRIRRFDEKRKTIGKEVTKLLVARFIREIHHSKWVANPMLVNKKNRSWRMCVNCMSLNKACPKDPFPLSCIDQVVDSTTRCKLLSFLDAYSGYHQIAMKEADQRHHLHHLLQNVWLRLHAL